MTGSLWKLPDVSGVKTPLSILKEQAEHLTSQTGGDIVGIVSTSGSGETMFLELKLIAPALNRYTYTLLTYFQKVSKLYPGTGQSNLHKEQAGIENEQQFLGWLRDVLTSPEVEEMLGSLLAQARQS